MGMLLAQPYGPKLFEQGAHPWAKLLLETLQDAGADDCWVRQTTDPVARQLALYELAVFRRLLTERVSRPEALDQAASRPPEPCL